MFEVGDMVRWIDVRTPAGRIASSLVGTLAEVVAVKKTPYGNYVVRGQGGLYHDGFDYSPYDNTIELANDTLDIGE